MFEICYLVIEKLWKEKVKLTCMYSIFSCLNYKDADVLIERYVFSMIEFTIAPLVFSLSLYFFIDWYLFLSIISLMLEFSP